MGLLELHGFLEGAPGGPPPTPTPPAPPKAPGRFSAELRRRPAAAALLALALAAPAGELAARRAAPSYRAEAVLYVAPAVPRLLYTDEEWRANSTVGFYNDYLRTLCRLAVEPEAAREVCARLDAAGVRWAPPGVPPEEAPLVLRARLEARVVGETHLISVGFEDADPAVVAPVVDAAAEVLAERVRRTETAEVDARTERLRTERARLRSELAAGGAGLELLAARIGPGIVDEKQNFEFERVRALQDSHAKLTQRRIEADAARAAAESRAAELRAPPPAAAVDRLVDEDPSVQDARTMLGRLVRETEEKTADFADVHPARAAALARAESARRRVEEAEAAARARLADRLSRERAQAADELLAGAERAATEASAAAAAGAALVEGARGALAEFARDVVRGQEIRRGVDLSTAALDRVERRLEESQVEARATPRVQLRSRGVPPSKPVRDRRLLMRIAAGAAAAAVGAGLVALGGLRRRGAVATRPA